VILPPDGLFDRILAEVRTAFASPDACCCEGQSLKAARLLGINRNTLRKKLSSGGSIRRSSDEWGDVHDAGRKTVF
jgi:DNA-binding protein Fis